MKSWTSIKLVNKNFKRIFVPQIVEISVDDEELIEYLPIGFIKTNLSCEILQINQKALDLLQIKSTGRMLYGHKLTDIVDSVKLLNKLWSFTQDGWKPMKMSNIQFGSKYLNIEGKLTENCYYLSIMDNTATSVALDKATQSLLTGQENEKRRISREIHDSLGQALSAVRLHLDFAQSKLKDISSKRDLSRIANMISEIAAELRNLSHDLMPSSLIDFGITTAIHNLIKRVNQTNAVYIYFEHNIDDNVINQNYELNIYRIIQELVNNAIKHAECDEINIMLFLKNGSIQLTVADNGRGTSVSAAKNGIGLYNIKNRVVSIKGSLDIKTARNKGFKATINIPYSD